MLRAWSAVLATLLCLTATQYAAQVSAMKATSLKLRANPMVDLKITKRDFLTSSFRPNNQSVFGFFVDVVVGTPPQFFSLAFSSSSTTWLPSSNMSVDAFCDGVASGNRLWACFYDQFFEPNKSSTFQKRRGVLDNYYGTGLFAKGTWGSDDLKINQLTISNVSFGLASNWTNAAELGLGVERDRKISPYPSIPEVMAEQGHINSILYSIYVNEIQNDGGELFFGAVDDAKYTGELRTFDSAKVGQIPVNGVYWIEPDGTNSSLVETEPTTFQETGELQLGTPSLWVPDKVYLELVSHIPSLQYSTAYKAQTVDCSIDDAELGTLQFDIDGTIISIHTRQMLVEYPVGSNTCVLTVYQNEQSMSNGPEYLLGSPFLRSAYSVWDFTNNQTSLGQSVPNALRSVVREVPRGGISDLRPPDPDRSDPSTESSLVPIPTAGGTVIPTQVPEMQRGTNVGAIVGGSIGGAIALGLGAFLTWFIMKRRRTAPEVPFPPPQAPVAPPGSRQDGIQPDVQHNQFGNQYKPQMTQHAYGVQVQTNTYDGQPNAYQENTWGTTTSNEDTLISGGTYPPGGQDLSSYAINGNPRQSGQYNYATEMPAQRYTH